MLNAPLPGPRFICFCLALNCFLNLLRTTFENGYWGVTCFKHLWKDIYFNLM